MASELDLRKRKESVTSCLDVLGVSSAFEVVCVKRCHYQSFVSSCFHQVTFCCEADFDTQHFLQVLGTFFVVTAELTCYVLRFLGILT